MSVAQRTLCDALGKAPEFRQNESREDFEDKIGLAFTPSGKTMTIQNYCRMRLSLLIYVLWAISEVGCFELDDEGDHLGALLTSTAEEMITHHQKERILTYHPRRGAAQHYLILVGKHYACPTDPCDAPFNENQGGVLVHVARGRSGTGSFGRVVSVPRPFSVDKNNRDTTILLRNKGWYVELAEVS